MWFSTLALPTSSYRPWSVTRRTAEGIGSILYPPGSGVLCQKTPDKASHSLSSAQLPQACLANNRRLYNQLGPEGGANSQGEPTFQDPVMFWMTGGTSGLCR